MTDKLPYHKDTAKLIERMCRNVEREDFVLDKEQGAEAVLKTYDLFGLERPKKVVWCIDVFDKRFDNAAWSARAARAAGYAGYMALDYDFDWYVYEFEYCKNPDEGKEPNENDKKYLEYCELLMQARDHGVGYRVEQKDTLYLAPTPLVKIDELNRFHSLSKPAISWKGGTEIYMVHGVRVDKKIILHPEKLTKKDWMNESNQEVRRVIQEQMGERFVKAIGSKEIHKSSRGRLVEIDISPDPEKVARYVEVQDSSTARKYFLRVPPGTQTADEAVAWTFGLDVESYKPEQET